MATKKEPQVSVLERQGTDMTEMSSKSSSASLKSPRTARFAEDTAVVSPIEPSERGRVPWALEIPSSTHLAPQPQPADVGFGYIGSRASTHSTQIAPAVDVPMTPKSPLKSALKSPGAPPRMIPSQNPLSPTWQEEESLDKEEEKTEKQQQKDVRIKARVRIAKIFLRFTNFSCSLIVISMMASTFTIFNATRSLPPRNNLPPWAQDTTKWPAILLLVISSLSLFLSVIVLWNNWRKGHRRAEKAAVYYTTFAMGFFVFNEIMWVVAVVALQSAKDHANGNDIWGWSCKENARKELFKDLVDYDLVCRLQNWGLVCALIEVVVELITILIYGVMFYRFFSKRALRKSMARRDTARSDLYLAQLRSQSAPNTPGLASPRDGGYNPMFSPRYQSFNDATAEKQASDQFDGIAAAEEGVRYVTAPVQAPPPKEFKLAAAPPKRNTPKAHQEGFDSPQSPQSIASSSMPTPTITQQTHQPAAPGEKQYDTVPIPGAYSSPIHSPTHPPNTAQGEFFQHL